MATENLNIIKVKDLYWDKHFTVEETARQIGVSFWTLNRFMNKYGIRRRTPADAAYLSYADKPVFQIRQNLSGEEQKLKIAGTMLYWAEGTFTGNAVDFANSNPEMIKIFLRFLRDICGIREQRLRVYLYAYQYQNISYLKKYWSKTTRISIGQFTKPYVRAGNKNLSKRKLLYGLVHIRYNDKKLLQLIKSWVDKYVFDWAGTQAAKGDRLCLTQRPAERRDGKAGEFRETLVSTGQS